VRARTRAIPGSTDGWIRIGRPEVSARCFDIRVVYLGGVSYLEWLLGCLGSSPSYRIGLLERTVGGESLSVLSVRSCVGELGSAVLRKRFACRIDLGCGVRVRVRVRVRIFQSVGMAWGYRFVTLIRIMHDSRCQ
jgi:hypothetical protein